MACTPSAPYLPYTYEVPAVRRSVVALMEALIDKSILLQIFKIKDFLYVYGAFASGEQPPARIKHLVAIKDPYGA